MTQEFDSEKSQRAQALFSSIIKSSVQRLSDRLCDESYTTGEHLFDSATCMLTEAAQVAMILEIPEEEYMMLCTEIYNIVKLMMTDHAGTA
jgi:hypothetical protein